MTPEMARLLFAYTSYSLAAMQSTCFLKAQDQGRSLKSEAISENAAQALPYKCYPVGGLLQ